MLLSASGDSKTIILGEVPPVLTDQDQDSAHDVAAQWKPINTKENNVQFNKKMKTRAELQGPVPQPRYKSDKLLRENIERFKKLPEFILDSINYYKAGNAGETDRNNRYKVREDNMRYLGEGIAVPINKWEIIQLRTKPSLFLNDLIFCIWERGDLCNRGLDLSREVKNISGRSPVKLIEPEKLRLLINSLIKSSAVSEECCKFVNIKTKKLIPVDFDLKLDEDEDNDDNNHVSSVPEHNVQGKKQKNIVLNTAKKEISCSSDEDKVNPYFVSSSTLDSGLSKQQNQLFFDTQLASYDLATKCSSAKVFSRKHAQNKTFLPSLLTGDDYKHVIRSEQHNKNTINFCLSPLKNNSHQQKRDIKLALKKKPVPKPRNIVNDSSSSTEIGESEKTESSSKDEMLFEDRLSLTLEEIIHIRCVLTKAELESLPVEGRVKEDVERRRVCFLCLKTRFGLLGPWGQCCQLCNRTVCIKCFSKMRIPSTHFAHVPVTLLSPGLLRSPTSSDKVTEIFNGSWIRYSNTIVSAPTSPATKRYHSNLSNECETESKIPNSTFLKSNECRHKIRSSGSPLKTTNTAKFATMERFNADGMYDAECIRRTSAIVCHDCRLMLIQIIKSSRITRANIRNNVISRLTLNLSPAYV